ncbi:PREDICTED: inducible metalloproteinase inhibitor protein-like [Nicrophorus vespilloides]|uniref:Inducible metalloproteinase inhibitor protein-like n=1 Tax=Nicrophorus vespilloides TaxID=110193 RepID=A0ABM1MH27_NICVS|nr:PREDICTED: inducible metalloproteinase inhibitor protein-like [Nicrophorus vespilloides]
MQSPWFGTGFLIMLICPCKPVSRQHFYFSITHTHHHLLVYLIIDSTVALVLCVCQINAYYDPNGIPKGCFRPNEKYACGSACQVTCATLGQTCDIINKKCNDRCYCEEGYARDQTGSCVSIDKCNDRLNGICGINEELRLDFYTRNECIPQLLTEEVEEGDKYGCYCIEGYLRDPSGLCVPFNYCPMP